MSRGGRKGALRWAASGLVLALALALAWAVGAAVSQGRVGPSDLASLPGWPFAAVPCPTPDYGPLEEQLRRQLARGVAREYGLYFVDLPSGRSFGIYADRPLPAASVVKIPIVLGLYQQIARGEATLDQRVAYDARRDYEGGDGVLRFTARNGDAFALRVLAKMAISVSDNVATQMIIRHLGRGRIVQYMRALGGRCVYPGGENLSTARDAATYLQAALDFQARYPVLGRLFFDDLAYSIYHVGLPGELPPDVVVAHKEGSLEDVANDAGIVFCRRPFILTVFLHGVPGEDAGFRHIARLARLAYDYQMRYAPAPGR
ncbi:MAG: serine hydrolase [Firmicutes bacterium]|nr:serine hydrolase [Bacillota bacterium]